MPTKSRTDVDPLARVLGPTLRPRDRRPRWLEPVRVAVGLALAGWFFWWIGWQEHVVGEAITLALVAGYERARATAAKRDWPRLRALGARTRFRCTCDQCERLRREEQS